MKYCPKCKGDMFDRDAVCPHCGYDFPPEPDSAAERSGIAYSVWAEIALMVGAVAAGLFCLLCVVGSVLAIFQGEFIRGLFIAPLCFFLSLAMLVVFLRIQKL